MTAIRAVIFDVGNVLIEWNPRHLYRKLFDDDEMAMERFLSEICTAEWNSAQDAGRPFARAVADLCAQHPQHGPLIAAYHERWEEMVPAAHDATIALVRELKDRGWPLYALTNFSTETFPLVVRRFDVFQLFDGIVVSGELGIIKPDPAIFRHLLERFALPAEACLFIDDAPANVDAARSLGMHAILYTGGLALRGQLAAFGVP
jgi:2-haloacid dehalogenase